jgi:hypothetical protein
VLDRRCYLRIVSAHVDAEQFHSQPSHVLVVAHRISVLFSLWLTIVRRAILMIVKDGVSFGAVGSDSDMGLTIFGLATENSILHQDA